MKFSPPRLFAIISGTGRAVALRLVGGALSWFASPASIGQRLTLTRRMAWVRAPGWWQVLAGSLASWGVACAAAVIVLHDATSDVGARVGAYRTGIAALILFTLAAVVGVRRRISRALPNVLGQGASRYQAPQNPRSHNFPSTSWSIEPKTWQRIHIALAIGAMLPLWWHCDFGRASIADLLLKRAAMLLLMSGFLGISITDLSRWRLLSPKFSPRFSSSVIRGLFTAHRGLALVTFTLITIHVLAVLYFGGV
jgi:hypothetical protein